MRAYVAAGATIITNEANVAYYQKLFNAPHTLDPDDLAKNPKEATIIPVKEKVRSHRGRPVDRDVSH